MRNLFSVIPFVLLNLMASEGAEGGGGGEGAPTPPPPDPDPVPTEEPKPEGATLEARLTSATGIIGNLFKKVRDLTRDLTTVTSDKTKLDGQFNAANTEANRLKGELGTMTTSRDTEKTRADSEKSRADRADGNVTRLESLCQLRGLDPNTVVPPVSASKTFDDERAELVSQLDTVTDPLKRGEIANQLRSLDRKRKAA